MMCQGEKLGDVFLMLGFFVFVFCANVTDCGKELYFRNDPTPAAACAGSREKAEKWIESLNKPLTLAEGLRRDERPQLGGYTFVAGAYDGGAVLCVMNQQKETWVLYVPGTKLEEVTSATIDGLIRMFAQAKEAYEKLSLPKPPVPTNSSSALTSEDEAYLRRFAEKTSPVAAEQETVHNLLYDLVLSVPGKEQGIIKLIVAAPEAYQRYFGEYLVNISTTLTKTLEMTSKEEQIRIHNGMKDLSKLYAKLMIEYDRLIVVSVETISSFFGKKTTFYPPAMFAIEKHVKSFNRLLADGSSAPDETVKKLKKLDNELELIVICFYGLVSAVQEQGCKIVNMITEAPEALRDYFLENFLKAVVPQAFICYNKKGIPDIDILTQYQLKLYAQQMIQDGRLFVISVEILLHSLNLRIKGEPNYPCQTPPHDLAEKMNTAEGLAKLYVESFNEIFKSHSAEAIIGEFEKLNKQYFPEFKRISEDYETARARHMETKVNPE